MLPLTQLLRTVVQSRPNVFHVRTMASKGPLVDLTVDSEGIATLTMQRAPVNSLNLELLQELSKSFDEIDKNKSKAMILTSASPTVFSAGLDIMEMYKPDMERVTTFWTTLQDVWLKLYGSRFIATAAINGHAPAGGCLLAMSCEYRAMAGPHYTIGLNETALGMVAPKFFIDCMRHTVSVRETERALTTAKMYSTEEAFKVGMIDDMATDKADAVAKCKQFIKLFDKIPAFARTATKLSVREVTLRNLAENRKQDLDTFLSFVKQDKTQMAIGMYIENLKKKIAKK